MPCCKANHLPLVIFIFKNAHYSFLRKWKKFGENNPEPGNVPTSHPKRQKQTLSILWKGRMAVRQQNHRFVFWKNVICNSSRPQWQALYLSPYYAFSMWNVIYWPPKAWRILFCISPHEWFFGRVKITLEFSFSFPYGYSCDRSVWIETINQ